MMSDLPMQQFRVRLHDMDAWQQLRATSLLHMMDQITIDAAAAAGLDPTWFATHQTAWVVRSVNLQRINPASYGDDLAVTTWVSDIGRVKAECEYEIRRSADGTPVAVGRAERVYIDRTTGRPQQLEPRVYSALAGQVHDPSPLWSVNEQIEPFPLLALEGWPTNTITHPVYWYEADMMGHTNHTVYADWLQDAASRALKAWGYPLIGADPAISGEHYSLEWLMLTYSRPTRAGDTVTIVTTRNGPADDDIAEETHQIALTHAIYGDQGTDDDPLAGGMTVYQLAPNKQGALSIFIS